MSAKFRIWIYLLLLSTLTFAVAPLQAQRTPLPTPGAQQWDTLTSDNAFGYKNEKEAAATEQRENNALVKAFAFIFTFFASTIGKSLLWLLLFGFAAWALYKIFLSDKTYLWAKREKKPANTDAETIDDISAADWNKELQKAIANNNARLAIRYSYMLLLQLLQEKGEIQYRPDKTNYEYYHELNERYQQDFRALTRQYEYTWYGNFEVTSDSYSRYMHIFNHLKSIV